MPVTFPWADFERDVVAGLTTTVDQAIRAQPDRHWYAAALWLIYAETDGMIGLPALSLNSEEALAGQPDVRWNPADWEDLADDWLPARWQSALTDHASGRNWQRVFDRYLTVLVRACRQSRKSLRAKGYQGLVVIIDDDQYEPLLRRCLTAAEIRRHFPELDEELAERTRVARLPESEQVSYYLARLGTYDGLITGEQATTSLRDLDAAALPALIDALTGPEIWRIAKMLAEIGRPDDAVIAALDDALRRQPGEMWVACALSRLGRLDLVLAQAGQLPAGVVVAAAAAPYRAFRDYSLRALPLDYRPLEDFLDRWPNHRPAVEKELAPGTSYCHITEDEVAEAVRGTASPYEVIRQHAESVPKER